MSSASASTFPIPRSEIRRILGVVLVCFAVSHWRRREISKRWLKWTDKAEGVKDGDGASPKRTDRLVDHPFVPYLLENTYLFLAPVFIRHYFNVLDPKRPFKTFVALTLRNVIHVVSSLVFIKACADGLYSHVPYFSTITKPSASLKDIVYDYLKCNLVVDVWMSFTQTAFLLRSGSDKVRAAESGRISVFPFLDFGYKYIHYRHHEHTAPRLQTNFHFFPLDLFLEAGVPIAMTAVVLHMCGVKLTITEGEILGSCYAYFEAASHAGKEVPVVTWFPPLSPIIDAITNFDHRLVEYHTRHHQLYNCNYSISPWPDMLLGSYKMGYDVKEEQTKDAASAATTESH